MGKRVICISHATGAGGEDVGRAVAQRLGLRYVDDQIVLRAAAEGGVSPDAVIDAEGRKSAFSRLFRGDDSERERRAIGDAVRSFADEGDVVIAAHGASFALGAQPGVLRVLVTAPVETRVERNGGDVKESDAGRAAYLKSFYGVGDEQPTDYDLVVNTERIETARAAELIAAAAAD